jgi:hypothetical protein
LSRSFSFRDLLLIPALSRYNEIELLHPVLDPLVNSYLGQLGFNMGCAIQYIPSKHRDMQDNVAVGFRACGEISTDRDFINSPLCSITERMIAAYQVDPGLAKELANLMGNSISFKDTEYDGDTEEEDFPEELVEADYEDVANQIRELEKIRDQIRGYPYDEYGSLKLPRMT